MYSGRYSGAGIILLQDCALSLAASLLSVLLVRWLSDPVPNYTQTVLVWLGAALCASLVGEILSGSHRVVRRWATVRSTARLITCILIKEVLLVVILIIGLVHFPSMALSVLAVMTDALITGLELFYIRFAVRVFSKTEVEKVKTRASLRNALVYGTDTPSVALARELSKQYNVVGFLTDNPNMSGRVISDVVVFHVSQPEDIKNLEIQLGGIDCVFFPKRNLFSKDQPSVSSGTQATSDTAMADISTMSRPSQYLKRAFDILLSGALLIIFSPLSLLCALLVKLEDGGPILYRQERMGRGGKPFYILKFRSMRTDAEKDGAHLYAGENDSRLTRVGGFLRRHHLDELPQLWNVFRGDMSFIGYRPEREVYIEQIMQRNPRYSYLYQIRPGVTSYATLYNGYTDTMDKMLTRLDLDLYYLRNQSLWFDAKVLGLTFLSIVSGKEF